VRASPEAGYPVLVKGKKLPELRRLLLSQMLVSIGKLAGTGHQVVLLLLLLHVSDDVGDALLL
jgi:hypothetical protein